VQTFEKLAALSPAIAANIDPSHFFWMHMDANLVVQRLGDRIGYSHGKDVVFRAEKLALNGCSITLADAAEGDAVELRRGRPGTRSALVESADGGSRRRGRVETISIEHEDPFVAPEIGIPQASRLLAEAIAVARGPGQRMSKVRAAVTERPGLIAMREFPMPDPAPGAAIMKVHYSGFAAPTSIPFAGRASSMPALRTSATSPIR